MFPKFKLKILLIGIVFFVLPISVSSATLGERVNFFVDSSYDLNNRSQLTATLQKVTPKLYFYIDDDWLDSLTLDRQREIDSILNGLGGEFENKIYPTLTSVFGQEIKAGINKDEMTTVLLHQMKEEAGGYFRNSDLYPKIQAPDSNERKIIYLNTRYIDETLAKIHLAHEFTHLIEFNQKDVIRKVSEETWLNEGRAEYVSTLLSYDDVYLGSNLQRRIKEFLVAPYDSITEWQNTSADYGALNLFIQYLVDHYGIEILSDSLKSAKVGIPSINEALVKHGFTEDFSQIFTDWTITVLVNDCTLGPKYCYSTFNLRDFKIVPQTNFLPLSGESTLSIINTTKDWSGNWQKFIGGKNVLKLEFQGNPQVKFKIPYLIEDSEGKISINFLQLDKNQKGIIYVPNFNTKNRSLTIIPSVQTKISGFNGLENSYQFSFVASALKRTPEEEAELIKELQEQIDELNKQIAQVQAKINDILASRGQKIPCSGFERDLYFGMTNSAEVICLQQFLKSQDAEIYPEGLVTGNFLALTQAAVKRYQEKNADEILKPLGLAEGTGYFGSLTRALANQILVGVK